MNTVLIAEDDKNIQDIIAFNLEKNNFKVFTCENGEDAIELLKEENISIVLMDIMMPIMNGFDCTRKIREFSNVPIIMLTALEEESKILEGFDCGIDDYVVKPFSFRQLLARINANIRRSSEEHIALHTSDSIILQINNIELNTMNYRVRIGDKESELTASEYNLFMFFYNHPNQVFNRDILVEKVWGQGVDSRTVDVCIKRLREKIEKNGSEPENIKTKRGKGYYLEIV